MTQSFSEMLSSGVSHRVHAMGVCGIGLSGVATLLKARGWDISGCDASASCVTARQLASIGVEVHSGHSPSHVQSGNIDVVVFSPAVSLENAELAAAKALGIPLVRRGTALAALASSQKSIAVCGTHGKTTTSCFVQALLSALGDHPSWCIGGYTPAMGATAGVGDSNGYLVVEADESDGTLAEYRPTAILVTGIEPDHLENFTSFGALMDTFASAVRGTSGPVLCCADEAEALAVVRSASSTPVVTYGCTLGSDYLCEGFSGDADSCSFDIVTSHGGAVHVSLPFPGRHNALNATGAFAMCVALGFRHDDVAAAMQSLQELPLRRFERHSSISGAEIISDYSHHPTEISALVSAAAAGHSRRLVAVFQPHRFSRTKALACDFPRAFRGIDELLLLPVYAASEKPMPGGRSEDLYREFRLQNETDPTIPVPKLAKSIEEAARYLAPRIGASDRVLVIGAGDVVSLVPLLERARPTTTASSKIRTSLSIGGEADEVVYVTDADALRNAVISARSRSVPVRVAGQGTNILLPDTGVGGVVVHLSPASFSFFERVSEDLVRVGCALSGARLLSLLRDEGLSGLECMAGIPGCVGGWLAMNAGTRNGEFGDCVVSAEGVGFDGYVREVSDFGFGYRRCAASGDCIFTSVTLRLRHDTPETIGARMRRFAAERFDFSGLRTAGSVFRNPPGDSAGRLLDAAGCKGLRVGGARVCERHANIISVGDGATASDFVALAALMRDKVEERFGISLCMEVKEW